MANTVHSNVISPYHLKVFRGGISTGAVQFWYHVCLCVFICCLEPDDDDDDDVNGCRRLLLQNRRSNGVLMLVMFLCEHWWFCQMPDLQAVFTKMLVEASIAILYFSFTALTVV